MRRGLLVFLAVGLLPAGAAQATATFNVTKQADTNDHACTATNCSLRDAVIASNAVPGPNTINLKAGHYRLTIHGTNEHAAATGDLNITKSVTIKGAGASSTTIDANKIDRVFQMLAGANLKVSGVTVTGGAAVPQTAGNPAMGGAVLDDGGGSVSFANAAIIGNVAAGGAGGNGGAIDVTTTGSVTIANTTLSGNRSGGSSSSDNGFGGAIEVDAGGPVTLDHATVTGNQAGGKGASGYGGVFDAEVPLTITASTIANNTAGGGGGTGYGGVFDGGGPTVTDTTFRGNHAGGNGGPGYGGVLISTAHTTMTRTILVGNTAGGLGNAPHGTSAPGYGGAIYGEVTLIATTVSGNRVGGGDTASYGYGGGVDGPVTAVASTFSGNKAGGAAGWGYGGGIYTEGANTSVTNSTVSGNVAGGGGGEAYGGGISAFSGATITLDHSDVVGNAALVFGGGGGGGVWGTLTSKGSIVADNGSATGPNCNQAATSMGSNLENGTSCGFGGTGDLNTEPHLGPLAGNGGPTATLRLLAASPALGHGGTSGCPATDQRGVRRPQGSACDIGAFELALPLAVTGSAIVGRAHHASLSGLASNPDVVAGSVFFAVGKKASESAPLAAGAVGKGFTISVGGLKPGRTYHYRLVARNPDGTSFGADKTFKTPVAPRLSELRVKGATVSYTDSQAGVTTFTVLGRGNKVRSFKHKGHAGENSFQFSGKQLAAGSYRLRAVARNSFGSKSRAITRGFQVS